MTLEYLVDERGNRSRVVLKLADYERLVVLARDAKDVADARTAMAEESLPIELVDRIMAKENRVLVWREHRGLTQAALAQLTGLRQASISDIESGKTSPRMDSARKIADALNVDIDDLF